MLNSEAEKEKEKKYKENEEYLRSIPSVEDGVYEVADHLINTALYYNNQWFALRKYEKGIEEIKKFQKMNPNMVMANGYQTSQTFFFSEKPNKLPEKTKVIGPGFNYGTTSLICNCPKNILIIAEDD